MKSQLLLNPDFMKEALVQTLVDSLWQGALVVMAIWIIKRLCSPGPQWQYFISLSGLCVIALLSLSNFISFNVAGSEIPNSFLHQLGLHIDTSAVNALFTIWTLGVFVFFTRFVLSHIFLKKIIQSSHLVHHQLWLEHFDRIKNHYRLSKNIILMHSDRISSAFLTGVLKPIILIPTAWVNSLHPKEMECILAHEFSHIRSKDHWINLFIQLVEMIFYFNPAVHILISHIKLDRELQADQSANGYVKSPILYAKLILKVEEQTGKIPLFSIPFFKKRNQLRTRIESVLNIQSTSHSNENAFSLLAALSCLIFLGFDLSSENKKPLKTELISLYSISSHVDVSHSSPSGSTKIEPALSMSEIKPIEKPVAVKKNIHRPLNQLSHTREKQDLTLVENVMMNNTTLDPQSNENIKEEPKVVAVYTQTEIKLDSLSAIDGDGAWIISRQGKSYQPKSVRSVIIIRTETTKSVPVETAMPDVVKSLDNGNQSNQQ